MGKKSSLLVAAVIALALAVPSTAGASVIKEKLGKTVPIGTTVKGSDVNLTIKGAFLSDVICAAGVLPMEDKLVQNNGSEFELAAIGEGKLAASCGGKPVNRFSISKMKSSVSGSGTLAMFLNVPLLEGGTCEFKGESLAFTYAPGSSQFSFSGSLTVLPKACASKPITVTGTFALSELLLF